MADQVFTVPFEYPSQDGKTTINAKMWTNTKFGTSEQEGSEKPKGVIQIVHGMSEYIDRYDDLAKYFVSRGFVVCGEDHIGHGKSVSDSSEYGDMPANGGKDILLGDVRTLHLMARELYPDVPYIIYGHSMGSFITRAYIARFGDDLAACVLSGTGNVPVVLSKAGRFMARTLASIKGNKHRSPFIDNMGAGAYGKQIENARTPLDWLSTDEAVVDAYIADDLCGFMFTVGGYSTLLDLTAEVVTPACAAKVPKDLPIFLVAGDGDPVGDMGKGVVAAAQLLRDAGVKQVDEKIYAGMRHEIHNEIGHEQVYDDIASWIEEAVVRCKGRAFYADWKGHSMKKYIISLDEGTTSARSVLIDHEGKIAGVAQREFEQHYPHPGWVEHDPMDILSAQLGTMTELLVSNDVQASEIDSIGITNQRETTVVWNRETGEPIFNAIVWQCRRTASIVDALCSDPEVAQTITAKTGLIPDAYFSASKIRWILDNVEGARDLAEAGKLAFGTIDTWLIWALTDGKVHATDPTNASRTMLFDIHTMSWDPWLCELFDVPMNMLPEVRPSSGDFGETSREGIVAGIPIRGVAGDQQSALFGQCCFEPGQAKNTYGTGCFLLMNTGDEAPLSKNGLVTTVAASAPGAGPEYAVEGSVFMGGALIQWVRDGLGLIQNAAETEAIAQSVDSCDGVYIVPAFTGLGAPYWDAQARGAIYGLTRGTTTAHIVRAALEALAYQVYDLVGAMETDAGMPLKVLNVDGGASANNFLMQFQSDILCKPIRRPENVETTALGAAYLAGLATGFWSGLDDLRALRAGDATYLPDENNERLAARIAGWKEAVGRTKTQ